MNARVKSNNFRNASNHLLKQITLRRYSDFPFTSLPSWGVLCQQAGTCFPVSDACFPLQLFLRHLAAKDYGVNMAEGIPFS